MPADPQRTARALGDPTRHRLFRYIAAAPAPVSVAELTAFARLHHNAVRQHLAVLRDAGLVAEQAERRDHPGRPRLLYQLDPEAAGEGGTAGPYAWLAGMLSAAMRRGQGPRQAGRQEGRRRAAELAGPGELADPGGAGQGDPVGMLAAELTRRGFRPRRVDRGPAVDLVLGRCPFAEVAAAEQETVCELHLGLAEGLADGVGGLTVDGLAARDPSRAGCRLMLRPDPVAGPA
jgi:predicted ArsR family transcriptional regulator